MTRDLPELKKCMQKFLALFLRSANIGRIFHFISPIVCCQIVCFVQANLKRSHFLLTLIAFYGRILKFFQSLRDHGVYIWGTHLAHTFLRPKCFVRMVWTVPSSSFLLHRISLSFRGSINGLEVKDILSQPLRQVYYENQTWIYLLKLS